MGEERFKRSRDSLNEVFLFFNLFYPHLLFRPPIFLTSALRLAQRWGPPVVARRRCCCCCSRRGPRRGLEEDVDDDDDDDRRAAAGVVACLSASSSSARRAAGLRRSCGRSDGQGRVEVELENRCFGERGTVSKRRRMQRRGRRENGNISFATHPEPLVLLSSTFAASRIARHDQGPPYPRSEHRAQCAREELAADGSVCCCVRGRRRGRRHFRRSSVSF